MGNETTTASRDDEPRPYCPRAPVVRLHLIAVILLALGGYVRTLPPTPTAIPEAGTPEANWWGLWPVTYLPAWAVWCGGAVVVLYIALFWWGQSRLAPRVLSQTQQRKLDVPWLALVLVSVVLFGLFFLFPIVHTRWGDAFMLAKGIAYSDPTLRLTHSWQAPLDVFLHSQVWLAFHERFGWGDAVPVYRLLSPLAGAHLSPRRIGNMSPALARAGLVRLWPAGYIGRHAALLRLRREL